LVVTEEQLAPFKRAYKHATKNWEKIESVPAMAVKRLKAGNPKVAGYPWKETEDGNYTVKFSQKAMTAKGKRRAITVVNKYRRELMGEEADVTKGSTLNVAFTTKAWYSPMLGYGVSFVLYAVQVIEPVYYTKVAEVDDLGFDYEEPDEEEVAKAEKAKMQKEPKKQEGPFQGTDEDEEEDELPPFEEEDEEF
jgi:hypothetical protein